MTLTVTRVPLEATLTLRDNVLSHGHVGRPVVWPYDSDSESRNYAVTGAGAELIACVSTGPAVLEPFAAANQYRFHSMAVAQPFQRQGVGSQLLRSVTDDLFNDGADLIWATARDDALVFYEKFGMVVLPDRKFVVPQTGFTCRYIVLERAKSSAPG